MAQDTPLGFPAHTLPFRCGEVATLSTGSGARSHRRGMGACEGVPWKSRSVHGGSGRFVARGRAADGKNFFQRRAGCWGGWAETLPLQGIQGSAAQRGAVQKNGGTLGRADCSCEAVGFMLTSEPRLSERTLMGAGLRRCCALFMGRHGRGREEGS